MQNFVRVPSDWLAHNAGAVRDDVHLYWRGFFLAQRLMWMRLEKLASTIQRFSKTRGRVLDVGGGLGLMLPTLSRVFDRVTLLDLETSVAEKIISKYQLSNCEIIRANLLTSQTGQGGYDAIVAAAFLEHFPETEKPVQKIYELLKPNGLLFVDLPTENFVYRLGRAIGNIEKPADHYHGSNEIRQVLSSKFREIYHGHLPPRPAALFYQGVFQK